MPIALVSKQLRWQVLLKELKVRRSYNKQQYIHNFAGTLMNQLGIEPNGFITCGSAADVAFSLSTRYFPDIAARLERGHSDATLGKLASCGRGDDPDIARAAIPESFSDAGVTIQQAMGENWGDYLSSLQSGRVILLHLATAAIIAAMADNIFARNLKAEANDLRAGNDMGKYYGAAGLNG